MTTVSGATRITARTPAVRSVAIESTQRRRVLVVANRTAATPVVLDRVPELANEQPSTFALLIPDRPRSEQTDWTLELALPLLERAARGRVQGLTGGEDPF